MSESRILLERFIGRNGFDPPHAILKDQCVEALNVDWYGSTLGRKRGGATALATTGGTAFTSPINTLIRHVPTADDTAAELWGIDNANPPIVKRLAGGTAWADVTLDDAIASRAQDINAATLNGKLFLCYGCGTNASTDTSTVATAGTNYVVGAGVTQLTVRAWGAAGGADGGDGATGGGGGGFAQADIPVTPGETLSKRVGGGGARSASSFQGGGGGGYTGLFRGTTPLLIAPGGGGGADDGAGGAGGGSTGVAGNGHTPNSTQAGQGGTQAVGGALGGVGASVSVDYLIGAGGAGGGGGNAGTGGGGGAGGILTGTDVIAVGQALTVTVGTGGAGGDATGTSGVAGNDSVFNAHTASGGGAGGGENGSPGNGGSGGGGGDNSTHGTGTASQGNDGGDGLNEGGGSVAGGGGGGANATGATATSGGAGGNGGNGMASSISGASVTYGGGGGGAGSSVQGVGGAGGGGAASKTATGTAGTANTGGGGGGGGAAHAGGAGGSGIVIVRYLTSSLLQATGGTITTSGLYTIHTFTASGTFTLCVAATVGASLAGGNGGGWLSGGSAAAAGGTNGGGAGGAHGTAATARSGGGGGGGYFGGGGGSADRANTNTGGGGGGSSFVSGMNTQTVAGSGVTPGNTSDSDYGGSAGLGFVAAAGNAGRLVIHAVSSIDRLHVYDPNLSTPKVRRVGLATPGAPTAANTGVGAYAATLRYYRVRWLQLDALTSTKVIRRSEPGASVSFTPSGAGAAARVTQPTVAGEAETHWEIEASTDNITFYRLSQTVIGTPTYDDSAAIATYSANTVSDPIGMYVVPTSVTGIIATASRLLMAGSYATGGKKNRVWLTPVLGSADQGDDERIPTTLTSYTDLSELAGDTFVAFAGPLFNGVIFVFMQREIWRLTPTGDVTVPYLSRQVSDTVGAVHQKAICIGEDDSGNAAIYFVSYDGVYRLGRLGLQYLGRDIEDRWFGLYGQSAVNLTASNVVAHCQWHRAKHQVWTWLATAGNADPNVMFVFDPKLGRSVSQGEVRGGWSVFTGSIATARCSTLFSNSVGSVMSRDLKPHVGMSSAATLLKCDTTDTSDNGTACQATVTSGPLAPPAAQAGTFGMREAILQAAAQTGVNVRLTLTADYGTETQTSDVTLTASGSETRVTKTFDGCALSPRKVVQVTLGDASAVASAFTLDAIQLPLSYGGSP